MHAHPFRNALSKTALASVLALTIAAPAQAARIVGQWDPNFGGPFPNLGWKASVEFDVDQACLDASFSGVPGGVCAGFDVVSAQLDFYNATFDPNPDTSPVVQSFALNPNSVFINSINTFAGALTGVESTYFNSVIPSTAAALAIAGNGAYSFSLTLIAGAKAQLLAVTPSTASPSCASEGSTCTFSQIAPVGVFVPAIPEPQTYAMMLAGLAAVAFVARRRRSAR